MSKNLAERQAFVLVALLLCGVETLGIGLEVSTEYGKIRGIEEHDPRVTVRVFYGLDLNPTGLLWHSIRIASCWWLAI